MQSDNVPPIDASRCPLCGQGNTCAMEIAKRTGQPVGECWCVNANFSAELLAQIPPALQNKACICQACAQTHRPA